MIDEPVLERRPIGLLRDNAHSERAAENAIRDFSARCLARKALHLPVRGLECSVLQSAFVLPFRQNGQLRGRRFRAAGTAVVGDNCTATCSGSPIRNRCGTASTKAFLALKSQSCGS